MSFQSDIPGQELEHAGTGVEIMLNVKAGQELRLSRGDSSEVTRALLCKVDLGVLAVTLCLQPAGSGHQ